MNITFPTGLQLKDWSDQIILDLDAEGSFAKLADEDWQVWGVQFLANQNLGGYNLPNPYFFRTWDDWATRFCGVLG
jgi:hypothetical protein